ncbi:MAG: hypothetical protein JWO86_8012 [Myxococcaceae bacterium]|nr:hypothetical protein [Myxococcaceae bacterium]
MKPLSARASPGVRLSRLARRDALDTDQIARVRVDDRERVAAQSVGRRDVPFETHDVALRPVTSANG